MEKSNIPSFLVVVLMQLGACGGVGGEGGRNPWYGKDGGSTSSDGGGGSSHGGFVTEPDATLSGDSPVYRTAAELCAYVNTARAHDSQHPRSDGTNLGVQKTWDIPFAIDSALTDEARQQVNQLRQQGEKAAPAGNVKGDGVRYRKLWISGLGQENTGYQVTTREEAGDWNVAYYKGGLDNSSGTARVYLYYHDPGIGTGIRRMRIGCAGANAGEDPGAIWWTVIIRP